MGDSMSTIINATTTNGVVIQPDNSGSLVLQTNNNTTALTIDTSQNVGIGTTSPGAILDIRKSNSGGVGPTLSLINSASGASGNAVDINMAGNPGGGALGPTARIRVTENVSAYSTMSFWTYDGTGGGATQKMLIDPSGNVLVGTTSTILSNTKFNLSSSQAAALGGMGFVNTGASTKKWQIGPDANGNFVVFNDAAAGVYVTYGGTSWTANSDERLKTDLKPIENATEKVSTIRSVTGRYKTDEEGTSRAFLIAQDVQKVLPEAVNVQNDEQGTLGVAYTEVIPLLVAAIKEQTQIINDLKARVETLEAN
jgi:hypothetical protein